ncbi:hypothetical protein J2Z59_000248 [Jeotgalicoccus pinnipedialis]|nr:hypothetical protein [Jeotgalicoccus pinnipedialis]
MVDPDVLEMIRDHRVISYNRFFDKKGLDSDFFETQYE